jgi:hypothetical protein
MFVVAKNIHLKIRIYKPKICFQKTTYLTARNHQMKYIVIASNTQGSPDLFLPAISISIKTIRLLNY